MCNGMCMDCSNELNLCKLCVKCIKAKGISVQQEVADNLCATNASVSSLTLDSGTANNLCVSGSVTAGMIKADSLGSNSLCAKSGTINNLCVDNLQLGNFLPVQNYRATVNYSADFTYTLGSLLNFDNIVDDPNNNVSLSPFTKYTAPVSGYYMLTYKVNITNIQQASGDPILGTPIANPGVLVNGILVREGFSPFLSFFNTQKVILNSLITLQAGDIVTMNYNILAESGSPVAGTVDILGAGIEDGNSLFKIIFLSGLGKSGTSVQCAQCPTVSVPCAPVTVLCDKSKACDFDR